MSINKARLKSNALFEDLAYTVNCSIGRFSNIFSLLSQYNSYVSAESYYPEYELKSKKRILFEQVKHILKNGEINKSYFLLGLDRKEKRSPDIVSHKKLIYLRDKKNLVPDNIKTPYNCICVLRDKFLFGIFCKGIGISSGDNIGIINNGSVQLLDEKKIIPLDKITELEIDAFCKPLNGEQGKGTFPLEVKDSLIYKNGAIISLDELKNILKKNKWLIQQKIGQQHEEINKIHPHSINTIRIITINKGSSIEIAGTAFRTGTNGRRVDNWNAGGIFIEIDRNKGALKKYGYYKPGYGTKTETHPDSHIVFDGYKIPFFQEAVDQAVYLHKSLDGIHSIGWDIAITSTGPLFVEGNDNWDTRFLEIIHGGQKEKFTKLLN